MRRELFALFHQAKQGNANTNYSKLPFEGLNIAQKNAAAWEQKRNMSKKDAKRAYMHLVAYLQSQQGFDGGMLGVVDEDQVELINDMEKGNKMDMVD